jgi:hypothetical protein
MLFEVGFDKSVNNEQKVFPELRIFRHNAATFAVA